MRGWAPVLERTTMERSMPRSLSEQTPRNSGSPSSDSGQQSEHTRVHIVNTQICTFMHAARLTSSNHFLSVDVQSRLSERTFLLLDGCIQDLARSTGGDEQLRDASAHIDGLQTGPRIRTKLLHSYRLGVPDKYRIASYPLFESNSTRESQSQIHS